MPTRTATAEPPPGRRRPWVLPIVLAVAIGLSSGLLVALRPDALSERPAGGAAAPSEAWIPTPAPEGPTAALTVDFGNGSRREFSALPWTDGITVGDLLRTARDARPGITFSQEGAAERSLLTSLEGVHNQPAGGRCWLYEVDGRMGAVSFEVQPVRAGERVLWRFSPLE